METKINSRLFFMGTLCMLLTASIILVIFKDIFYKQAEENIGHIAQSITIAYNAHPEDTDLSGYANYNYRITLISSDGTVLYESEKTDEPLENHSTRTEVVEAVKNGSAQATRRSSTMGTDTYYCAVRLSDGNILRISQDVNGMWSLYNKALPLIMVFGGFILLISIVLSVILTKQLIEPITKLGGQLSDIDSSIPYPELMPFAVSLREYRMRESQNEQQRREFTANVSHELKTPLTSISGYAEMIENGMCRPEDIKSFGARIHAEAARMITLVGDIIRLTQLDEADAPPTFEKVDLRLLAENTADLLELYAKQRSIKVFVSGPRTPIMGNEGILGEMIYNLSDNAIKYNRPGGHVWITTGTTYDRKAFVEVKDDGIGIPQSHQARVFERFYRVDKSHSRESGGTGLGLAIVKHAVSIHGGSISLNSKEGGGTTISVTFPEAAV
ncbi:MAG: ATP-binding protein [Clostridiaceae bacterium]|nr:ATP-binding protein [Clostridiaceae bacterium]